MKSPIFLLITFLFTHSKIGFFYEVLQNGCVMFYVTAVLFLLLLFLMRMRAYAKVDCICKGYLLSALTLS